MASDTGSSSTDNITAATTPIFRCVIKPFGGRRRLCPALLNGSPLAHPVKHVITAADVLAGRVSLTVTAGDLGADGSKEVTAQFSDAAGNSSISSALSFVLDTTAPAVAITSGGGRLTRRPRPLPARWMPPKPARPSPFLTTASVGSAIVQSNGSWSSSVTLQDGSNSLTAQVTDLAGNTGASTPVVFTLSTAAVNDAPTATNLSTAEETYTENTPLNLVDIVVSDVDSANVTATPDAVEPGRRQPEHGDLGCGDLDL